MSAEYFRLANLLVHCACVLLVVAWLRRRTATSVPASVPASVDVHDPSARHIEGWHLAPALIVFAWHPLQVEVIAWVSGLRDLLATAFALAAIVLLQPEVNDEPHTPRAGFRMAAAVGVFTLAMLAKPSPAGVPLALLLMAYASAGARGVQRVFVPVGLMMLVVGVVAFITARVQHDLTPLDITIPTRLIASVDAVGFYALKVAAPVALTIDYGRIPARVAAFDSGLSPAPGITLTLGGLVIVLIAGLAVRRSTRRTAARVAVPLALLAPVLGFVPFSFQQISTVAGHYMYLPMAGLSMLIAWATARISQHRRNALLALSVVGAPVLLAMSWQRSREWSSADRLFEAALARNARSRVALVGLAALECTPESTEPLPRARRLELGRDFSARALALSPDNPAAIANRAVCLYESQAHDSVIALIDHAATAAATRNLTRDDESAASFLNAAAGALLAEGHLVRGWVFLCAAAAVQPANEALRANVAAVAPSIGAVGLPQECPPRVPLGEFFPRDQLMRQRVAPSR